MYLYTIQIRRVLKFTRRTAGSLAGPLVLSQRERTGARDHERHTGNDNFGFCGRATRRGGGGTGSEGDAGSERLGGSLALPGGRLVRPGGTIAISGGSRAWRRGGL